MCSVYLISGCGFLDGSDARATERLRYDPGMHGPWRVRGWRAGRGGVCRLGVRPDQVVLCERLQPLYRWLAAEGAVWSFVIVEVEPAGEGVLAFV